MLLTVVFSVVVLVILFVAFKAIQLYRNKQEPFPSALLALTRPR